jgi:hypothetical protein
MMHINGLYFVLPNTLLHTAVLTEMSASNFAASVSASYAALSIRAQASSVLVGDACMWKANICKCSITCILVGLGVVCSLGISL